MKKLVLFITLYLLLTSFVFADETITGHIQFRPTHKLGIWSINNQSYWGIRQTRLKPRSSAIKVHSCVRVEVNSARQINKVQLLTISQCHRNIPKPYQFKAYKTNGL